MNASTNLKVVDEDLDEIEGARRLVDQAAHEKAEAEKDGAAAAARLEEIDAEQTGAGTNWKLVDRLVAERSAMQGRKTQCEALAAKAEAKLRQAAEDLSRVSEGRLFAEALAGEPGALEAVLRNRDEIEKTANAFIAALVAYSQSKAAHDDIRVVLARGGRGVAPEATTRALLLSLGIGRGAPFKIGSEFVPFPVPTAALPFP